VQTLVFSSTAAVYGDVDAVPIPESAPLRPTSPYGESKLAFERQLASAAHALDFTAVALRYFNAAGAVPEWQVGEDHEPEEHLIPRVLRALAAKQPITVYGDDWPTPDGTCVRDYIHVHDLARAHVLAIEAHTALPRFSALNVGTGHGASVRQVITAAATATGIEPEIVITPRRPGDPPQLVADPTAIQARLGWQAQRSDLAQILGDAAAWEGVRG
jgi:UDP-glucose 4-epimerase